MFAGEREASLGNKVHFSPADKPFTNAVKPFTSAVKPFSAEGKKLFFSNLLTHKIELR
jgi:hypothetical protein